jgi:hypothetical protein
MRDKGSRDMRKRASTEQSKHYCILGGGGGAKFSIVQPTRRTPLTADVAEKHAESAEKISPVLD